MGKRSCSHDQEYSIYDYVDWKKELKAEKLRKRPLKPKLE